MNVFPAPVPPRLAIDVINGQVSVMATDRIDVVVDVTPYDVTNQDDLAAVDSVGSELTDGQLRIRQTISWRRNLSRKRPRGSVVITVQCPTGTHVKATLALGGFHSHGLLGKCTLTALYGSIQVCESDQPLKIRSIYGNIMVGRALDGVEARTTAGHIRVEEAMAGLVDVGTVAGTVEVGVLTDSSAELDCVSRFGRVNNGLTERPPVTAGASVAIKARTNLDDIIIHRR